MRHASPLALGLSVLTEWEVGNVAALLGDVAATRQESETVVNHGRWGAAAEELDLLDLLPPEPQLLNLARPTPLVRMRGSSRASGLAKG